MTDNLNPNSNQKQAILDVISLLKKSFNIKDDDSSLLSQTFADKKSELQLKLDELQKKETDLKNNTQNQIQFIRKQRNELRKQQNDISNQFNDITQKTEALNSQEKVISNKQLEIHNKELDISEKQKQLLSELEKIANLSKEEAVTLLCEKMNTEAQLKADKKTKEILSNATIHAQEEARKILVYAIQKDVQNVINEFATCAIELPDDNIKGKIIGREGRNIKTFEELTGVTVVVDDTPEMIVLSCYEPIRREIARIAMVKLINDGRIHPRRIEDLVEAAKVEMDDIIFNIGKETAYQFRITNIHPEILKMLGRLKYRTSYSQNCLAHCKEVAQYCADMATELNLDRQIATRAALLHDIGKSVDRVIEGTHAGIGYDLAKKYNEDEIICRIIAEHHDDEPTLIYTWLVRSADALSSGRPGIRHDTIENYVKRLNDLEQIANSFRGIKNSYAMLAGRELRVAVEPDLIDDAEAESIADKIKDKIENTTTYPGEVKIIILREKRYVRTAT